MKPHEQCKKAGLKSLKELCEIVNLSRQVLIKWSRTRRALFDVIVLGGKVKKDIEQKEKELL